MNFEEIQNAWQSQDPEAKVTINADVLLKEVKRNEKQFRTTIFLRDLREVGVAFFLTVYFLYRGLRHDWTDSLLALTCFAVGIYMLIDRLIQNKKRPTTSESLVVCIESSLKEVNHQIWLLRNIVWNYLLPLGIAIEISVAHSSWQPHRSFLVGLVTFLIATTFIALVDWGVYWLNQSVVNKVLEPRRRELEALKAGLN